MNYASTENQRITAKFVDINVHSNVSLMIETLLNCENDLISYDDIDFKYDEETEEMIDIYEWWIVSDYLADKLKKQGETIIEIGAQSVWGRTCTGQAILLDEVLGQICEEIEILEGQTYAW